MASEKSHQRDQSGGEHGERVLSEGAGGRTYYINIPIRPLWGNVSDEDLDRITIYYTIYAVLFGFVGAAAFLLPFFLGIEIQVLLAWLLVLAGTISLIQFLLICGAPSTIAFLLLGVVHLGTGLWLLLQPLDGTPSFVYVVIVWFVVHGIAKLAMGHSLQRLTTWPAILVSGLASIAAAFVVLALHPRFGDRLISWCFGADLGLTALAMILISFMAFLGKGHRTITDAEATGEPLLGGQGGPAAASA